VKTLAIPPDAEHVAIDYLTTALAARGQDVTVGVDVPTTWATTTKSHVQVALDGTPIVEYPITVSRVHSPHRVGILNDRSEGAGGSVARVDALAPRQPRSRLSSPPDWCSAYA